MFSFKAKKASLCCILAWMQLFLLILAKPYKVLESLHHLFALKVLLYEWILEETLYAMLQLLGKKLKYAYSICRFEFEATSAYACEPP